ncbi:MAG: DNA modification methylase, partial [candidate division WOR-3 bacterium]|nr:DNA modification methylase [candidate division WOR-3 bacterium]
MRFEDLIVLYEEKKKEYGERAYEHISELLQEAKAVHKRNWKQNPTENGDHEQSWRAFKGKNLEKLIIYIIKDEVERLGLKIVEGNTLERKNSANLPEELN